jgi:hypothetical protein
MPVWQKAMDMAVAILIKFDSQVGILDDMGKQLNASIDSSPATSSADGLAISSKVDGIEDPHLF